MIIDLLEYLIVGILLLYSFNNFNLQLPKKLHFGHLMFWPITIAISLHESIKRNTR